MTSLLRTPQAIQNYASDDTSIMEGVGVELFTTSCIETAGEITTGNGVGLFTTSCVEAPRDMTAGNGVQLFTTSC